VQGLCRRKKQARRREGLRDAVDAVWALRRAAATTGTRNLLKEGRMKHLFAQRLLRRTAREGCRSYARTASAH